MMILPRRPIGVFILISVTIKFKINKHYIDTALCYPGVLVQTNRDAPETKFVIILI